jgi:hypothetical protein
MALAGAANGTFRPRLITASADTSDTHTRRRHWKAGEFPFSTTSPSSGTQRRKPRTTERPPPTPPSKGKVDPEERGRQRHWKAGEFPAAAESQSQSGRRGRARTPIKNVKKRLDARADSKAWACTVTEALSDRIDAKNWQEALQVIFNYQSHFP